MNPAPGYETLFEQALSFQIAGEPQHAPLMTVHGRGGRYQFILDTGASDHVLTRSFAKAEGLTVKDPLIGTDHAGAELESWALADFSLSLDSVQLELTNAVAIPTPPFFKQHRIGGILSVPRLHPSAHVLLDFEKNLCCCFLGDIHVISESVSRERTNLTLLALDRVAHDTFILIRAAIVPGEDETFLINTGGKDVELLGEERELGIGDKTVTGHGVSGEEVLGLTRLKQTLRIPGWKFPVPKLILRESMGASFYSGDIGMSVLKNTVLLISAEKTDPFFWFLPGDTGEPVNH